MTIEPSRAHKTIEPHPHDILRGRGLGVQYHQGNINFRSLVKKYKRDYAIGDEATKNMCCFAVYNYIKSQNPPGRFLELDLRSQQWFEIKKRDAFRKIKQALREGAPTTRQNLKQSLLTRALATCNPSSTKCNGSEIQDINPIKKETNPTNVSDDCRCIAFFVLYPSNQTTWAIV